jgi:uncharacterized protein (DUF2141 family)
VAVKAPIFGVLIIKTTVMKTLLTTLIALCFINLSIAQEEEGITVTVVLENVLSEDGNILAALHNKTTFMRGPGIRNYKGKAEKGNMTLVFENVKSGTYAVSVLHDSNENNQMDFEANGMPKEAYAMSGNSMAMGPPNFFDVKFEVGAEDLELRLRF